MQRVSFHYVAFLEFSSLQLLLLVSVPAMAATLVMTRSFAALIRA